MRILVIDEEFPWPLNTGKRIRTYNLVRELSRYNQVSYMGYSRRTNPAPKHFAEMGIEPHVVPLLDRYAHGLRFYARLLANLGSEYPYIVTSHYTSRYQEALAQLVAGKAFDLIICEWTPYALYVRDLIGPKKIIVAHNLESAIWRRYEQNETNPAKRWYISIQRRKVEQFEEHCFRWVDGATAVSDTEANVIRALGGSKPVTVIDNGVDTDYFAPQSPADDTISLAFTGSMDWRPNQDACRYFVFEIWPQIRKDHPDARIYWVGRNPTPEIRELGQQPGVVITGTVDDVRPYVANASVYVVPLRIGGGSRLKILEAMAMKKAVVSTTVGAEGLRVVDGKQLLIADQPAQFTQAINRCLADPALRCVLGENGRRLVEEEYRWEQLGKKFHEFLTSIVGS